MADPAPSAITALCPDCKEETLHAVLKGTMGSKGARITIEGTVKCEECGRVHHAVVREPAPVEVPVVVSRSGTSTTAKTTLGGDETAGIGDEILVDGARTLITGIEVANGRRVPKAGAREIVTLWVKFFEELEIPVSVNLGKKTVTHVVIVPPEHELFIEDEIVFGKLRTVVHSFKTAEGPVRKGSRLARDVKRIYAHPWEPAEKHPAKAERDAKRWKMLTERKAQD